MPGSTAALGAGPESDFRIVGQVIGVWQRVREDPWARRAGANVSPFGLSTLFPTLLLPRCLSTYHRAHFPRARLPA